MGEVVAMIVADNSQQKEHRCIRILWVNPIILDVHLHKTGQLEILRHLTRLGHDTILIASRSRKKVSAEGSRGHMIAVPLRFVPLISATMFAVVLFFLLPFYVFFSKPDIVVTQPDVTILSFIPCLLSKPKKTKFILDIRSTPVETRGFRGLQQEFWFKVSVLIAKKLFDGVTIITSLMKKEICEEFNVSPNKVAVWTTGVSLELFDPELCSCDAARLKRNLGLHEKFVVFYHGVFTPTRGLEETARCTELLSAHRDVVIFLLGDGSITPMLKDMVRTMSLQNSVIIHPSVDYTEVPKFIGMSDVCIVPLPNHPYWRFQCPLKLLEYLSMEKTVIMTDIPAHRLIVGEEKCGIYISSIKPTEIAKSIEYAYHNKEKLEEWGKSGRTIIQEKYTWEKVARDLESYLLSV